MSVLAAGFTFGLTSIFYLFTNGFILSGSIIENLHSGVPFIRFLLLIPHGIFEVPALLLSGAIGFKGVELVIRLCFLRKKIIASMFRHIGILVLLIICLLIAAAIIEAYITPILSKRGRDHMRSKLSLIGVPIVMIIGYIISLSFEWLFPVLTFGVAGLYLFIFAPVQNKFIRYIFCLFL